LITEKDVVTLVSDLVRIDSSNSWLTPGAPGESEVAAYIERWLRPYGAEITIEEVSPGHPNMIAILRGTGGGKSLCLNSHLDTVGYAGWKDRARVPKVEGDIMTGLGAADDKGHCAAGMLALRSIAESGRRPRGDLWLALTADEEGTSSGTFHFVERHKPDAVMVLESYGLGSATISHQGFGWIDIIVEGKAAHGCVPEIGVDAIAHMAEVVVRLHRLDAEKFVPNPHPLNGRTVFHTGTIRGGADYASYPAECVLGIEIGTQPGETIDDRVREIEAIFEDVKRVYPKFKARVDVLLSRKPFDAAGHEELWKILSSEEEKEIGRPIVAVGENSWGDSAIFQEAGIPTLMLGAAGGNLHAPEEWVSIGELAKLARIVEGTARRFCA
jgi:acetylornithine deacetylase/succinyl-diaminopimelate desuccinylase-like protein